MRKKVGMLILWSSLTIGCGFVIWLCDKNGMGLGEAVASALIALIIERGIKAVQDLFDTTNWKTSQTRLKRGNFIRDDTIIRISFAYLYRIKVGNKYLLVQNSRNTGKYQPIGGVYKLKDYEKQVIKTLFHVMDDDKIPIDESSRNDYRLRMENRYLRKFVKRFNSHKAARERIDNVGREFREELIETGIVDWNEITYRYCGRHMTDLRFEEHFQIYEMLLADIVELLPTPDQEQDLKKLLALQQKEYRFATAHQIACLGMDIDSGELHEWIGDHTKKILQETETQLMKIPGTGKIYNVVFK